MKSIVKKFRTLAYNHICTRFCNARKLFLISEWFISDGQHTHTQCESEIHTMCTYKNNKTQKNNVALKQHANDALMELLFCMNMQLNGIICHITHSNWTFYFFHLFSINFFFVSQRCCGDRHWSSPISTDRCNLSINTHTHLEREIVNLHRNI